MKRPYSFLKKCLITAFAAAVVIGVGSLPAVSSALGTNVIVSALSSSPIVTYDNFQYILYSDKTAAVVGYTGPKDHSDTAFGMPSVLYSKNLNTTWEQNAYIGQYTITRIAGSVFNGCKFKLLGLPNGLETISGGFVGAQIGFFTISTTNPNFAVSSNGALYNKNYTELVAYPSAPTLYQSTVTNISLLPTAKTIGSYAFTNQQLSQITIPSTVTTVKDRVFTGSRLRSVVFKGSPNFTSIPPTSGNHGSFEGATELQQILIDGTGGPYTTYSGALYNRDQTKLILCPQGRIGSSYFVMASTTTSIADYAFYGCKKLSSVLIPDNVTGIGSNSFAETSSAFAIYGMQDSFAQGYAKGKNIPFHAIYPYTVNSDGTITITGFDSMVSSISIPKTINGRTVSAIGEKAFYNQKGLKTVFVPYGVKTIGSMAFRYCTNLQTISFPATLETIENYAFANTGLTKVELSPTVVTLGTGAFYSCQSLESVTLDAELTTIGSFAFENTALTAVTISDHVTSVGSNAFGYRYENGTHSRVPFNAISGYPGSAAHEYAKKSNIPFNTFLEYEKVTGESAVRITKYVGTDQIVTIPDYIDGLLVRYIGEKAFNNTPVIKVYLPSHMNRIDSYAFYGATFLKYLTIPSNIKSIGSYAFEFCVSLPSVSLPSSVTSVGYGAFYGCTGIKTVYLGLGIQTIDRAAFANTGLTSVIIPQSIQSIGSYAFGYDYTASSGYQPVCSFTMTGYAYTAAEPYAAQNPHIIFNVKYEQLTNTSSFSSKTSGNEKVTVNLSGAGGKRPLQYAVDYRLISDGGWTTAQTYSENNAVEITFPQSGKYEINTRVQDDRGVIVTKVLDVTATLPLKNTSVFKPKTISLGKSVKVKCVSTGGTGSVSYAVWYRKDSGKWYQAQDYSLNEDVDVTPKHTGTYTIRVKAKDQNDVVINKDQKITVVDALKNTSVLSDEKIYLGDSVTANCASTGGVGTKKYEVWYKSPSNGKWYKAQAYATTTSVKITPKHTGVYTVRTKVKDANGTVVKKDHTVTVAPVLKNTSKVSSTAITLGKSVTVTCTSSGGFGTKQYAVWYKTKDSTKWTKAQDYSSASKVSVTPKHAAEYTIRVNAKDENGKVVKKDLSVTVSK